MIRGKFQGQNQVVINAPLKKVWEVLKDSKIMPRWLSIVKHVDIKSDSKSAVGEVRDCKAEFRGKPGQIVERCIEFFPHKKISYIVDKDSFGFTKMFSNYWFSYELEKIGEDKTLCTMKLYYQPKKLFAKLMNIIMKGKFSQTRQTIINGLKKYVEGNQK